MKVCIIEFQPSMTPRRQLFQQHLANEGHDTSCVVWDRDKECQDIDACQVYRIGIQAPTGSSKLLLLLPRYWLRLFRILVEIRPDAVVIGHFLLLPVAIVWKRFGAKRIAVYDSSEYYARVLSNYFGSLRSITYPILCLFENLCLKCLDGVLCVDSYQGQFAARLRKYNSLTQVIWNVPSLEDDPEPQMVQDVLTTLNSREVVVYVGGLKEKKGIIIAMKALAIVKTRYPNILFLMIGRMDERCVSIVQQLIQDHNLKDNVRVKKPMAYRKMLAYVKCARIGLALYQEHEFFKFVSVGNGRKFFTYMQAGIPVLGPQFREIGEVVRIANCGILVDTTDPQEVSDAICSLLDNPELALRLGANGRRAFEMNFNWERESHKLSNFFEKIGLTEKDGSCE